MRIRKAFTLIELLVVISIIALLLSILMPALSKVKEQGRMTICRSNEKGLVLGAILWSEDHDDWAIATDWFKPEGENETESALGPYLDAIGGAKGQEKGIFACPSAAQTEFFHVDPSYETDERKFTYAVNGYITLNMTADSEGSPGRSGPSTGGRSGVGSVYWTEHGVTKMSDIRMPSTTAFFIDHEYYFAVRWTFDPTRPLSDFPDNYRFATRWHKKKPNEDYGVGNIGWVDGHVSVEPSDFADKKEVGGETKYRWKYYFYDH
ncbi:MAG: prepilin-type N-terminal cleavage/methylation domain-containing protein [Sedimentisphaerales bacterium]|nr:prepilin-type N-terminal cleavage/methylation domain-containing protein [Sedimentisphaerales bacterium]